jgi:hypothetical protein
MLKKKCLDLRTAHLVGLCNLRHYRTENLIIYRGLLVLLKYNRQGISRNGRTRNAYRIMVSKALGKWSRDTLAG